jgi:thiamine-monophosphate kinase
MNETVADVGEFGLIDRLDALIQREGGQLSEKTLGIGDDCAVFRPSPGHEILVTCDCMVEGRHYLPEHTTPFDLGRRAMALNISDIGAMGGVPCYAVVSLGLRGDTAVAELESMYRGFLAETNPLGAAIVGGNITKSDVTFIDITLIGEVAEGRAIRRSAANIGDVILVTGYPGQAATGLQRLLSADEGRNLREDPLVQAYNRPEHRAREGKAIAQAGGASAMIDTSDGLLGDLGHICEGSKVGALLYRERLPVSEDLREAASQMGKDPYDLVLSESDDYELLISCPEDHVNQIRATIGTISGIPVTEIGRIVEAAQGIQLIFPDGTRRSVSAAGWDHFG